MKEKCSKYEGLFVFSDEKINEHINECEDCKKQDMEFKKLDTLIKSAKPLYFKNKRRNSAIIAACAVFLVVLCGTVLNSNYYIFDTIRYGQTLSAEDYGFPVDSYGLITVGE